MSVSIWRDGSHGEVVAEGDVAVVGGGIAGLAVARQCVARGLSPVVIEARDLAAGATGRNAGFAMTGLADSYASLVSQHGRDRAASIWRVSQANLRELVEQVAGAEGVACDLVPCGSVIGAWTLGEWDELQRSCAMLREDGFAVEALDREAVGARLGSTRFHGGLFVAADHGVHPVKLVHALAARVRAAGGRVLEHHEVRSLGTAADGRVRVSTARGDVLAPRAVLATNAYARQLEPYFATRVRPVRGQALATAPVAPTIPALVYTDDGFQYARQLPDGRVVAGGWRRFHASTEVGYGDETTVEVQRGIESFLHEAWPSLREAPVTHRWSGVMGFSDDGLPLVGRLPDRPAVAFVVGFTGHGMGFALAAARAVVDLAVDGTGAGLFDAARTSS